MKYLRSTPLLLVLLAIFSGCSTPPPPEPQEAPDLVVGNLVYRKDGFMDNRTGWIYPQILQGQFAACQAWDENATLIGIAYLPGGPGPDLAMSPQALPSWAMELGTVTILTYPVGYRVTDPESIPDAGNLPSLLGLGYGHQESMDEFWAYQKALEDKHYNLWKLVKLVDANAPGRTFHSLLVLKRLSSSRSDGIVVTIGQMDNVYTLVVIHRYVRTREDVDQFGEWAYAILRDLGLQAVQE